MYFTRHLQNLGKSIHNQKYHSHYNLNLFHNRAMFYLLSNYHIYNRSTFVTGTTVPVTCHKKIQHEWNVQQYTAQRFLPCIKRLVIT